MAKPNLPPTKSNLLAVRRQLAFAEEGYDLLEQKRGLLIFELMRRLARATRVENALADQLADAFTCLKEAMLEVGSEAIDRASIGVPIRHEVRLAGQRLMGLSLPGVTIEAAPADLPFGVVGTSFNLDLARMRFTELLPLLAVLAELQSAVFRLARELRKTQRRCNALSKIFIPSYTETINYITASLEERERESLIILKRIRNRFGSLETA